LLREKIWWVIRASFVKKISILLVAGKDPRFSAVATEAAGAAFPGIAVSTAHSLKEALGNGMAEGAELLVLCEDDEAIIREAAQAVDGQKLPRWAVVAPGESNPDIPAERVPAADWNHALLARVLRGSLAFHAAHRERMRLRGDLLTIGIRFTHDLRTPVSGIVSSTEVVDATGAGRPGADKSLTQPIFESANDLVKIIGQLSLVAKASARPDSRQQFNMAVPIGRALEKMEMRIREKGASVSKPQNWPNVSGDPSYTEAVWVGLLDNAVRHSGKAPKIEVGWEAAAADGGGKFWVRDQGPGILPEKQRFLFFPFHRLHEPSAPKGLGLPIVDRLVGLQGGRCGYESVTPSGAGFFFTLPQ
jgi:signal transduction histidine kinase